MYKKAIIHEIEQDYMKKEVPEFNIGDTVKVHVKIVEGDKERIQVLQGTVIARQGHGLSESFTIHRVAFGEGMERVFLLHSPRVVEVEVVRRGSVRRAKLYYLRGVQGKKARVKTLIGTSPKKADRAKSPAVEAPAENEAAE
jgi:large subunit ribosomal protein L19